MLSIYCLRSGGTILEMRHVYIYSVTAPTNGEHGLVSGLPVCDIVKTSCTCFDKTNLLTL